MTTTIDEVDVDTQNIFALDFTYAPECEFEEHAGEECDSAAEYRMILSCCAELWLLCEDHMLETVNYVKNTICPQHNPKWGGCGGAPIHFTIIERL